MSESRQLRLVGSLEEKRTEGQAELLQLDPIERQKRAFKLAGILFGLGVFSVFIPIAHFVLVPGFLIGSVAAYFIVQGKEVKIQSSQIKCPSCETQCENFVENLQFPTRVTCDSCRKSFSVAEAA